MDRKKILIIVSIIMIIVSIGVSVYLLVNKSDDRFSIDGINLPKNQEILKETNVDGLKITNISLLTRDGISTFKAEVINEKDIDINIKTLSVIFYEGKVETKVSTLKNGSISSGNSVYINIVSERDLSKTTKIEYVLE